MTRRIVAVTLLALFGALVISAFWLLTTEAGLQWAYAQLRTRMPGTVEVQVLRGRLAGPLEVRGLDYRSDAATVRIKEARLEWSPLALLAGRLDIGHFRIDGVNVALPPTTDKAPTDNGGFALPFNVDIDEARISDVHIERGGQTLVTIHRAALAGYVGQQVARIEQLEVIADKFELAAEGTLGRAPDTQQALQVRWRAILPGQPEVAGAGIISGNLDNLILEQSLSAPVQTTVRAQIHSLLGTPTWQAQLTLPAIDPKRFDLRLPLSELSGDIEARGDRSRFQASGRLQAKVSNATSLNARFEVNGTTSGRLTLDELTIQLPDSQTRATATGQWRHDAGTWEAHVRWEDAHWPLRGNPRVVSPQGSLAASGDLKQYHVRLEAVTIGEHLPRAAWHASGGGDLKHIALPDVRIETLGTTLNGNVRATWSPQLRWEAMLHGRAIDPAVAWPQWPGLLVLRANAAGDEKRLRVHIDELRGTLRGQPVAGSARVVRYETSFPTIALRLQAGRARASAEGSVGKTWNAVWQLEVPKLGALLPEISGSVKASGRMTGPRHAPQIEAQASAAGLAYETSRVQTLTVNALLDTSDRGRSHVTLRAAGGEVVQRAFERIAIDAAGYLADHSIDAELRFPQVGVQVQAVGGYAERTWSGMLTRSLLQLPGIAYHLVGQPRLTIAPQRFVLAEACWRTNESRLCASARRVEDAAAIELTARNASLTLFAPALPTSVDLRGVIDGQLQAQLQAGHVQRAHARVNVGPGLLTLGAPAQAELGYDGVTLRLDVDDQGLHAAADIDLADSDSGSAELELRRFHANIPLAQQPLDGRLKLTVRDLSPLADLIPAVEAPRGTLRVDLALAGTVGNAQLRGEAALLDASARIVPAGITLQNVRLTATATGGNELRLNGEARSGGGQIALSGRVVFPPERAWRAELRIAGAQFQATDLRQARVYVSPDLRARLTPASIDVTGDVRIPKAVFALARPTRDAVTASPDVVIVNAPEEPTQKTSPWAISAQIQVTLGDAVTFSGFGLDAKIAGSVFLTDKPGQATSASGELRVSQGAYEAYGQKLEIERGRLLFVGGPVSNPGIDARAVRRVDNVTAGVEVKGTLQSPQLTLFSDPAMGQADALSYLLFGRPMSSASSSEGRTLAAAARALRLTGGERLAQWIGGRFGIEEVEIETGSAPESAALVLGKQLSPRLYINYSIGLFEPENVLRLRYRLTPNWSLEAQSGTSSGGDLLYTIER